MGSDRRIPSLDGLRAFSILLVVLDHLGYGDAPYQGAFGVTIFFVISGYLITRLLQQEHEKTGCVSLCSFYRRRTFRIFPAAFAYIAIAGLLGGAAVRPDLPYAFTYSMSYRLKPSSEMFGHLWSLSVEEQFYLLWPFALVFAFRHRGRIAIAAMVAAALFRTCCHIAAPDEMGRMLHFWFPSVMDSIASGCLLAIYEPYVRHYAAGLARYAVTAPLLLLLAYFTCLRFWSGSFPRQLHTAHFAWAWGIVPLLIAACVFVTIERRVWILNNPVAGVLGALSYSLYLWQQPFTLARSGSTAAAMFLLLTCAGASYVVVERPMIRLGKLLHENPARRQPYGPRSEYANTFR